ncbi:probable G-protein coupled receptor 171 [Pygocentrus nattereri]|uniref:G-protein coupled receptors family 1 profile domain-containing protein n=1 Tax=Pygocentrus nattereri TaxID=42514 RepID=A0A3B4BYZ2_PYGNA|nr:probable G-protein coupled receptor 171 [Pygocentrus nattereri]
MHSMVGTSSSIFAKMVNNQSATTPIMKMEEECVVNDKMIPFASIYILIFLIGLAGSLVALWAFIYSKNSKKCINVYLINLLTSDFLLTLALPFKIAKDLGVQSQRLTIFHCQVSSPLIYINMYASIIFLAFVSVHRYLQITHSSKLFRLQEVGFAVMMSVVVWLLVLFINVPNMAIPIKDKIPDSNSLTCADLKQEIGKHWHTLSAFLGMAIFLNASAAVLLSNGLVLKQFWGRRGGDPKEQASAHQATVNITMVTVAYVVCFVPYHAVRMPYTFTQNQVITDCSVRKHLFLAKESTLLLAILNLCFDPVLYFFFCRSFRNQITQVFSKRTISDRNTNDRDQELQLQPVTTV